MLKDIETWFGVGESELVQKRSIKSIFIRLQCFKLFETFQNSLRAEELPRK